MDQPRRVAANVVAEEFSYVISLVMVLYPRVSVPEALIRSDRREKVLHCRRLDHVTQVTCAVKGQKQVVTPSPRRIESRYVVAYVQLPRGAPFSFIILVWRRMPSVSERNKTKLKGTGEEWDQVIVGCFFLS